MFLIILLFCVKNYGDRFLKINEINSNTLNEKNNSGYDERFGNNKNISEIFYIKELFAKKKLLDILNNDNISIYTKLIILNDKGIKPYNLFAGGLMYNFDFDFEDF